MSNRYLNNNIFQFTTSQGGRLSSALIHISGDIFQFTTSQGGRQCFSPDCMTSCLSFNSRPLKEVDQQGFTSCSIPLNFQFTTSQGGRLDDHDTYIDDFDLSIHDLSRRSTIDLKSKKIERSLSIHDLSRRSTLSGCKRDICIFPFQFTTSQGGRPDQLRILSGKATFNSRPLKEVDLTGPQTPSRSHPFNSRPLKEVDALGINKMLKRNTTFNSRPLKEVDVLGKTGSPGIRSFQFTTSQGGRLVRMRPLL